MNDLFDISKILDYLDFDYKHIEESRIRQSLAWKKQKLEYPIIFCGDKLNYKQENIPDYNLKETFYDKSKMLCSQARLACQAANGHSDSVPSIRANLGTGILLSCFGLEQEVYPDKMPWLKEHLSKEKISKLSPGDIKIQGSFERGLEMMHYFKETTNDCIPVFVMDTQGPFDLAHLLLGDQLFLELYDDPPFVHHLMEICFQLGIKTHHWMKEAIGEPLTSLHHSNAIFSDSFSIRICEDTTALLGDEQIREFAIPYSVKLAKEFGAAWIHYCGYNEALTDALLEVPEFKVINFGHIPGHEYEIDFCKNMEKFQKAGKINWNWWPKFKDEKSIDYLKRLHYWANKGILAPYISLNDTDFKSASELIDIWKNMK